MKKEVLLDFSEWLREELNKREWSQSDLRKRMQEAGYNISQGQLSHIYNGTREASPDVCIGIAYAFRISREEMFRMRGWLLHEPEQIFTPGADPRLMKLSERMNAWPPLLRETYLEAMTIQADAIDMAVDQQTAVRK